MPPFINIPCLAAQANAATILTGVEITNAQGQAPTTDEPGTMTHLLLMKSISSLLTQKKRKQEHT
jgi:uncharacterized protein YycO